MGRHDAIYVRSEKRKAQREVRDLKRKYAGEKQMELD